MRNTDAHWPQQCDERLPKGPRFASESLDAGTGSRSVFKLTNYQKAKTATFWGSRLAVIYDD
jgi:hypothetical protein